MDVLSNTEREPRCMPAEAMARSVGEDTRRARRPYPVASEARPATARRYAALDLGTNNCRLLIAEARRGGFRVVDGFSRIVRLGEHLSQEGALSEEAMDRAIGALQICASKLANSGVAHARTIATEACRAAANCERFTSRVLDETGLDLEVVDRQTEARLAVAGCAPLVDDDAEGVLLFDIGGGSSEIVWLDLRSRYNLRGTGLVHCIRAWTSLPIGVVSLAERHGGKDVDEKKFAAMVDDVLGLLAKIDSRGVLSEAVSRGGVHLLGTSGTVTTLAGLFLGLKRYDRRQVDGTWLDNRQVDTLIAQLLGMSFDDRVANPCIGADRADLVLAGCAIFEAIRRRWPCERLRVADRGLREGMLMELIERDRLAAQRSRRQRRSANRVPIHA
ncbi:Ppx/GppA phosphatase family protein [Acuticoccus sp. MNP-M23]|uniref:Ppx/GppA phosphatase family protein n=1 Tax=Acuticoccus sp. MNP-M23 TaxID=3072793 RepID=UPI002815B923|nr:Ppx/GppA phosphatase family protein [Acuticoccus sp. MNP-M23]WMS42436.1 Ppx/GppA phosphatase family protein [Acuticoccus sp. MNP-M23]